MSDDVNNNTGDDKGREPTLLRGNSGQLVSQKALVERIEQAFMAEYAGSNILAGAVTNADRLKLILGTVDYVLSVESVRPSQEEKAALIKAVYGNLFAYGPLDALFLDERVTTIALDGANKVAVRYGHGELVSLGPIFDDEAHLKRILERLLVDAGAGLKDDLPFIETGLMVGDRPICVTAFTPVLGFNYNVDIRVHPRQSPTLDELVQSGFMNAAAAQLLQAIIRSGHGLVIVGETESGKTTLLNALAQLLPQPEQSIAVERAGELRLPEGMAAKVVQWPGESGVGLRFGDQITAALAEQPQCIVLDEVRTDDPSLIAPLLRDVDAPRQIWSFRGPFDEKRLRSALGMLARRADPALGEEMVNAMYARLPFVVTVWRARDELRLYSIAEWQHRGSDYPDYVPLLKNDSFVLKLTGEQAMNHLDLPVSFFEDEQSG